MRDLVGIASAYLAEVEAATGEIAAASTSGAAWPSPARLTAMDWCASASKDWGRLELEMGRPARPPSCTGNRWHSVSAPAWLATITRLSLWAGWAAQCWRWATGRGDGLFAACLALPGVLGARPHRGHRDAGPNLRCWKGMSSTRSSCWPSPLPTSPPPIACAALARLLAELEADAGEQFAAAAARGQARELDEVVAELIGKPA